MKLSKSNWTIYVNVKSKKYLAVYKVFVYSTLNCSKYSWCKQINISQPCVNLGPRLILKSESRLQAGGGGGARATTSTSVLTSFYKMDYW